jgi:hypothetical protein
MSDESIPVEIDALAAEFQNIASVFDYVTYDKTDEDNRSEYLFIIIPLTHTLFYTFLFY